MKIVADRDIPFLKGVIEPFADMVYLPGSAISAADVRDADALLTRTRTRCDEALLSGSRVRFIGTATIGFDHIDRVWCETNGITVCTSAGCNARGVLQWVSAALAWLCVEPARTTLGVVGVGNVGSLVAQYATDWGFRVMRSDPPRERAEGLTEKEGYFTLEQITREADIITFHVPLDASTRHLVDHDFLEKTKPGAVILNSSRGPVIEPEVLKNNFELSENNCRERGAPLSRQFIIDTWNNEPNIDRSTLEKTLLATPHIAGYSAQGKANATAMAVNQLARFFGLPIDPIELQGTPKKISWDEMRTQMPQYFDISEQSRALKANLEDFEKQRDNYKYRTEFF